jgi:DNA-directed RNA polymerase specialized sigma24 family protein
MVRMEQTGDDRRREGKQASEKLPNVDVLSTLRDQGWTYDEIAREYGVSRGAVELRLATGRTFGQRHKPAGPTRGA